MCPVGIISTLGPEGIVWRDEQSTEHIACEPFFNLSSFRPLVGPPENVFEAEALSTLNLPPKRNSRVAGAWKALTPLKYDTQ